MRACRRRPQQSFGLPKRSASTTRPWRGILRAAQLTQFLVRSMDKVKTIALWHALTHNMVCTWRLMPA
jgi:hypothetical protein